MRHRHVVRGALLAALSVVGFASTFVAGGELAAVMGVSPAVLALVRFVVAGMTLLLVGLASPGTRRELLSVPRRQWLRLLWLGPVGTVLMAWCVFKGCALVSVANSSMADALTPLGIFAVSTAITRRATPLQILGLLLGFTGALFTIRVLDGDGLHLSAYGIGDLFILGSAATWGIYTVFGRDDIAQMGSYAFSTWTMLIGAAVLALALCVGDALSDGGLGLVWPSGMRAWGLTVFIGLFCTLMPFWAWNAAQNHLPLSVLGMSAYFTPAAAVLIDRLLRGNTITTWQVFGTVLICASAVVETGREHNE